MKLKRYLFIALMIVFNIALLSNKVYAQDDGIHIYGKDRYETSIKISQFGWKEASDTIVLATGEDFPDALSAAPLAKKYNAPILLTMKDKLSDELKAEINRLKCKTIYIIGGQGVISQEIENYISSTMGKKCIRLYGRDRYETSVAIANEIGKSDTIVIATGDNYADALSIAPWAAKGGVPILLCELNNIPEVINNYIKNNSINKTYVVGGTGVISDNVFNNLKNPIRLSGNDRYGTNYSVLNSFIKDFNLGKIYIATGEDFPDALSGASLASMSYSPVILSGNESTYFNDMKTLITNNIGEQNLSYVLGGPLVVPDANVEKIIPPLVSSISFTLPSSKLGLNKQIKAQVEIKMIPSNAKKPQITFTASNSSIAKVESDGTIKGIFPGAVNIIAKAGGLQKSLPLNVIIEKVIALDPGHGLSNKTGEKYDPGAVATKNGIKYYEATLNYNIVKKIEARLKPLFSNVIVVRDENSNPDLNTRLNTAQNANTDLFLSIHHDSVSIESANGTTSFYSSYMPSLETNDVIFVADGGGSVFDSNNIKIGNLESGKVYKYIKEEDTYHVYIDFNGKTGIVTLYDGMLYDNTPNEAAKKSKELALSINSKLSSLGLFPRGAKDQNLYLTRWASNTSVLVECGFMSNPLELDLLIQDSFQEKEADKIVQAIIELYTSINISPTTP